MIYGIIARIVVILCGIVFTLMCKCRNKTKKPRHKYDSWFEETGVSVNIVNPVLYIERRMKEVEMQLWVFWLIKQVKTRNQKKRRRKKEAKQE